MVRKEQAKRARKLIKPETEDETEETKGIVPPVVVEKASPSKPKEAMKQESFEFMEASERCSSFLPLLSWKPMWRRGRRLTGTA